MIPIDCKITNFSYGCDNLASCIANSIRTHMIFLVVCEQYIWAKYLKFACQKFLTKRKLKVYVHMCDLFELMTLVLSASHSTT